MKPAFESHIDLEYEPLEEGPLAVAASTRQAEWRPLYELPSPREEFAFRQLVTASILLENAQTQEFALRDAVAGRTEASFDRDRRREAEKAGNRLRRNPSLYLAELEATRHGAMWLLARWKGLGAALSDGPANGRARLLPSRAVPGLPGDPALGNAGPTPGSAGASPSRSTEESRAGEWTAAQKSLALDLLGVDPIFRTGDPLAAEGPPAELVARKVAELEERIEHDLADVDQLDREHYFRGLDLETSAAMKAIRRDQATHLRRYQAAAKLLKPARAVRPQPAAQPVAPPPPPPKPAASPPPKPAPTPAAEPIPAHLRRAAEIALAPAMPATSFFAPITVGGGSNRRERPPVFTGL